MNTLCRILYCLPIVIFQVTANGQVAPQPSPMPGSGGAGSQVAPLPRRTPAPSPPSVAPPVQGGPRGTIDVGNAVDKTREAAAMANDIVSTATICAKHAETARKHFESASGYVQAERMLDKVGKVLIAVSVARSLQKGERWQAAHDVSTAVVDWGVCEAANIVCPGWAIGRTVGSLIDMIQLPRKVDAEGRTVEEWVTDAWVEALYINPEKSIDQYKRENRERREQHELLAKAAERKNRECRLTEAPSEIEAAVNAINGKASAEMDAAMGKSTPLAMPAPTTGGPTGAGEPGNAGSAGGDGTASATAAQCEAAFSACRAECNRTPGLAGGACIATRCHPQRNVCLYEARAINIPPPPPNVRPHSIPYAPAPSASSALPDYREYQVCNQEICVKTSDPNPNSDANQKSLREMTEVHRRMR